MLILLDLSALQYYTGLIQLPRRADNSYSYFRAFQYFSHKFPTKYLRIAYVYTKLFLLRKNLHTDTILNNRPEHPLHYIIFHVTKFKQ